jgi:hypothetical protein
MSLVGSAPKVDAQAKDKDKDKDKEEVVTEPVPLPTLHEACFIGDYRRVKELVAEMTTPFDANFLDHVRTRLAVRFLWSGSGGDAVVACARGLFSVRASRATHVSGERRENFEPAARRRGAPARRLVMPCTLICVVVAACGGRVAAAPAFRASRHCECIARNSVRCWEPQRSVTPLVSACGNAQNSRIIQFLVDHGANVNFVVVSGAVRWEPHSHRFFVCVAAARGLRCSARNVEWSARQAPVALLDHVPPPCCHRATRCVRPSAWASRLAVRCARVCALSGSETLE